MCFSRTTLLGTASSTPLSQSGPAHRILSGPGNIQPKLRDALPPFPVSFFLVTRLVACLALSSFYVRSPEFSHFTAVLWIRILYQSTFNSVNKNDLEVTKRQCCGSVCGLDTDSMGSLDPYPGGQKWPTNLKKLSFWSSIPWIRIGSGSGSGFNDFVSTALLHSIRF